MSLLEETLDILKYNGKTPRDVLWVGSPDYWMSWDDFASLADTEYDSGFGAAKVAEDLVVVGDGWWLERYEYDGSEEWCFKKGPKKPSTYFEGDALTVDQANRHLGGYSESNHHFVGWETLRSLNPLLEEFVPREKE